MTDPTDLFPDFPFHGGPMSHAADPSTDAHSHGVLMTHTEVESIADTQRPPEVG